MSIKRHQGIAPLSRHHHHALIMALKISKLSAEPNEDEVASLKNELKQFWETESQEHFREEEEILLPAYAKYASIRQPEIIDMLLEHVEIRSLVSQINDETAEVVPLIRRLGVMLEQHVRKEERVIFPMIESALPEEVLFQLEPYFHEFHTGPSCSINRGNK